MDYVQRRQRTHSFAHSGLVPAVARYAAHIAGGNEAHEVTLVLHSETPLAGPQKVGINKRLQTHSGAHDGAITRHYLGDSQATKRSRNLHLGVAGLGRVHQKPSDECDPQAAKAGARKKLPYPIEDEKKRDELPDARGDASGAVGVFGNRPYDRAKHPATIERKAGNHVEARESNVDIPQPDEDPTSRSLRFGRTVPAKPERDREATNTDNQAGDRPGDRDQEFSFRVGRVVLDLGNTAEREQGDRPDFQAAGFGH